MAEQTDIQEPKAPEETPTPETEVETETPKNEIPEPKRGKEEELQAKLDSVTGELIAMRKTKQGLEEQLAKAPKAEDKETLEAKVKELEAQLNAKDSDLRKVKDQRNEEVLNSMASTPDVALSPRAEETQKLTAEQEALRKDKGWTVEKYLSMKAKYPEIVT